MKLLFLSLLAVPSLLGIGTNCSNADLLATKSAMEEKCLATMIYGEARGEHELGQVAVAYTAVNRSVNKSVCQTVLSPKQYSVFNNNPELRQVATSLHLSPNQKNSIDQRSWAQALKVARIVLNRLVDDPTHGASHYLAPKLMAVKGYKYPKWSKQYKLVATINGHKFYKNSKIG